MKAKILFVATLATAVAFVSCNKEPQAVADTETKTVKVDVSGVFAGTRGDDYAAVSEGAVQVNNIEVYLVDGSGNFRTGYDANGKDEVTWDMNYNNWSTSWTQSYHFVPAAVNSVIVVGNTNAEGQTYTNKSGVDNVSLSIANEQNPAALSLYGYDGSLIRAATQPDAKDNQPLYTANVLLKPLVSRLEISAFQYTGSNYNNLTIKRVFFTNYYEEAKLSTGDLSSLETLTVSQTDVFQKLQDAEVTGGAWYYDDPALTLNGNTETAVTGNPLAYCFFTSGATVTVPQVIVWLQSTNTDGTVQNLYLKTSGFYKADSYYVKDADGNATTEISANKENAVTSTNQVYQTKFVFGDEHLDNPEKCVDLTVSVVDWELIPVVTEFE